MKYIAGFSSLLIILPLLTACGTASQTEPESFSEGVDTTCRITDYHPCSNVSDYFLKEGDKVAVLSPSAYPSTKQRDATVNTLKMLGYVPVEGTYTVGSVRTVENIAEDIRWALEDEDIKAIVCVRGGAGSSEVLDYMGLEPIIAGGKLIVGFSDITTYLSAWTISGHLSIHGSTSGFKDDDGIWSDALKHMMQGEIPTYECVGSSYDKPGTAEGILIGGNLSVLLSVIGTAYDPTRIDQPYILFLEDTEEDIEHIHRYLTVLKHLGILNNAAGLIFGQWTDIPGAGCYSGDSRGGEFQGMADMIDRQFLNDLNIPVAFGFPSGHSDINYPLLMGSTAKLTVTDNSYTIEFK